MKKSLKIFSILACLALSAGFVACGGDGNKNGAGATLSYALNETEDGYVVVGYEGSAVEIEIPEEYNGKPVTALLSVTYGARPKAKRKKLIIQFILCEIFETKKRKIMRVNVKF